MKQSYVYYVGVTSNIMNRVLAHKRGDGSVFSSKYNTKYLLYCEVFFDIREAIYREKQIKRWHRDWKVNLIKQHNPEMIDLADDWYGDIDFTIKD